MGPEQCCNRRTQPREWGWSGGNRQLTRSRRFPRRAQNLRAPGRWNWPRRLPLQSFFKLVFAVHLISSYSGPAAPAICLIHNDSGWRRCSWNIKQQGDPLERQILQSFRWTTARCSGAARSAPRKARRETPLRRGWRPRRTVIRTPGQTVSWCCFARRAGASGRSPSCGQADQESSFVASPAKQVRLPASFTNTSCNTSRVSSSSRVKFKTNANNAARGHRIALELGISRHRFHLQDASRQPNC